MNQESNYIIYADGGSRGNPGEAAYGFVIFDRSKKKLYEEGRRLGIQTNNFAEYSGIIEALRWIENNKSEESPKINVFMDSKLAVEQLSGHWKIKSEPIRNLYFTVKELERKLGEKIRYTHVLREFNKDADRMVNLALDNEI